MDFFTTFRLTWTICHFSNQSHLDPWKQFETKSSCSYQPYFPASLALVATFLKCNSCLVLLCLTIIILNIIPIWSTERPNIMLSFDIGLLPSVLFSQNHPSRVHPRSRSGLLGLPLHDFAFLHPLGHSRHFKLVVRGIWFLKTNDVIWVS